MPTARCAWCTDDPLYVDYHDHEWGVPRYDDRALFELLILEGAQAGLSWLTVLKKRAAYRAAFATFDMEAVARYREDDIARLLDNPGIIRNRLKLEAAVKNARGACAIVAEFGSLATFFWRYVDGVPHMNHFRRPAEVPARTPVSQRMSKDLKKRGFSFVGPTICYAFMQAAGLVNDHTTDCFRHAEIASRFGAGDPI